MPPDDQDGEGRNLLISIALSRPSVPTGHQSLSVNGAGDTVLRDPATPAPIYYSRVFPGLRAPKAKLNPERLRESARPLKPPLSPVPARTRRLACAYWWFDPDRGAPPPG